MFDKVATISSSDIDCIDVDGIVLEKTDLEFENQAVLNPACIEKDGVTHMFYRAVREGNHSTIGYCRIKDGKILYRASEPVLSPEFDYESHGIEDPRIVQIDDMYYLFYTAFDGLNALIAYATSRDLVHFAKQGVISPRISYRDATRHFHSLTANDKYMQFAEEALINEDVLLWNKNAFLFPRKINGKFALIHRIKPNVQVIYFDDFTDLTDAYWDSYLENLEEHTILSPKFDFEHQYVGGGCPPLETPQGWLFIYHGVGGDGDRRIYNAGAALLDLDDPTKVIGRLPEPLFAPKQEWELAGDVNNVVFPTGMTLENGSLKIYYGAADSRIAAKSINLESLISRLQKTNSTEFA